jgi:hypothetical protein
METKLSTIQKQRLLHIKLQGFSIEEAVKMQGIELSNEVINFWLQATEIVASSLASHTSTEE